MRPLNLMERVHECEKRADTAPNPQARIVWKQMEQFWRKRIERPEPTMTFDDLQHIGNKNNEIAG